MKQWLLGLLASLLAVSLCGAIVTTVLDQTILNTNYVENKFAAVNGYDRLSTALSNDIVQQAGLANVPQVASVVQGIVTPTVVRQRVNGALSELEPYLQGKGSAPTINFSDLGADAQAAGVPLQQNSDLFHPITVGPSSSTSSGHVKLNISSARTVTIVTSVLLTLLLLALSWVWRRYTVLPSVLISVGVTMGLITLVAYFALGAVGHYIRLSNGSDALVAIGRDLAQSIGRDLVRRFGIVAAVSLVVGIGTRIWMARLQRKVVTSQLLVSSQAAVQQRTK